MSARAINILEIPHLSHRSLILSYAGLPFSQHAVNMM